VEYIYGPDKPVRRWTEPPTGKDREAGSGRNVGALRRQHAILLLQYGPVSVGASDQSNERIHQYRNSDNDGPDRDRREERWTVKDGRMDTTAGRRSESNSV